MNLSGSCKTISTWVVAMLLSITLFGQKGSVEGIVSREGSEQPVSFARVSIASIPVAAYASESGGFTLPDLKPGTYQLQVTHVGYGEKTITVTVVADQITHVSVSLIKEISSIAPAEVTATITGGTPGIRTIPGSAHYISPKELERFNYSDVSRVLAAVPGVNLQEEDGFGLRPNIGLRGTGVERSSKITLMEDGILMAPAPYAAPAAYYFPTIGRMNGVEIIKGSSQIQYGPYTTGGAINFLSTPIPSNFGGRFKWLGGTFSTQNLHAVVGNSHDRVAYVFETFQYGSDGFKHIDGGGETGFDKRDFQGKIRINTSSDRAVYQSLMLKLGYTEESANETYLGLSEEDFQEDPFRRYAGSQEDLMTASQWRTSLTHRMDFNSGVELTTVAYRNEFKRNWYKLDKVVDSTGTSVGIADLLASPDDYTPAMATLEGLSSAGGSLLVKANNREYYSQGIQTRAKYGFAIGTTNLNVIAGVRWHEDQMDRFQWRDAYEMNEGMMVLSVMGTPGTESNRIESASALATFIETSLKWKNLLIKPGVRYERISISREDFGKSDPDRTGVDLATRENNVNIIIPGIGVVYDFNETYSGFAGVHKGFSPPGSTEGALPEESVNYELGLRVHRQELEGQLVWFFNDYDNLLGSDLAAVGGTGAAELYNGGEAISKGIELSLQYTCRPGSLPDVNFPIGFAYTLTDAHFHSDFSSSFEGWGEVQDGDFLPYLARNQWNIRAGAVHEKISINANARFMDAMLTQPGQEATASSEMTDEYLVFDLAIQFRPAKAFAITADVANLFDETYVVARRPAGLRSGMPRTFRVGLSVDF